MSNMLEIPNVTDSLKNYEISFNRQKLISLCEELTNDEARYVISVFSEL